MSQSGPYRNPTPTVDVIIEWQDKGVLLIERRNAPHGWALPGGFMDEGETAEAGAVREAKEETSLDVELIEQFLVYSDPRRDPRKHTLSVVFIARAPSGEPRAEDDALNIRAFTRETLPDNMCFDHGQILADYFAYRDEGLRPRLSPGWRGDDGK